jgi:hypothetical protein
VLSVTIDTEVFAPPPLGSAEEEAHLSSLRCWNGGMQ